jgi:hypothetical protein
MMKVVSNSVFTELLLFIWDYYHYAIIKSHKIWFKMMEKFKVKQRFLNFYQINKF